MHWTKRTNKHEWTNRNDRAFYSLAWCQYHRLKILPAKFLMNIQCLFDAQNAWNKWAKERSEIKNKNTTHNMYIHCTAFNIESLGIKTVLTTFALAKPGSNIKTFRRNVRRCKFILSLFHYCQIRCVLRKNV